MTSIMNNNHQYMTRNSKKIRVYDHSPVDDAIPERLPQARLTNTVESLGLM